MTLLAKHAEPGKLYRLTRDSGTTYYKICDRSQATRLEKRLSTQDARAMRPEDRFALQALARCRAAHHVLAIRFLRFRDDSGTPRETRAYVDFPPDYVLREVDKPPGYAASKRSGAKEKRSGYPGDSALRKDLDTPGETSEDPCSKGASGDCDR